MRPNKRIDGDITDIEKKKMSVERKKEELVGEFVIIMGSLHTYYRMYIHLAIPTFTNTYIYDFIEGNAHPNQERLFKRRLWKSQLWQI